jgi:ABC-type multidrug transport system ATPase subunit
VHRPRVLLLDEPAAGLDPTSRLELRELLRGFATAGGTVLISSHDLSALAEIAQDAVFVDRGEVVGGERLVLAKQARREWRIRALDPAALSHRLASIGVAFDRVRIEGEAVPGDEILTDDRPAGQLFTRSGGHALAHLRFDRATGEMRAGSARIWLEE